jgi:hypothetical protein
LGHIYKEQGRTEEALQLLREISAMGQRSRDGKREVDIPSSNVGSGKNRRGR